MTGKDHFIGIRHVGKYLIYRDQHESSIFYFRLNDEESRLVMTTMFSNLCDQITLASSSSSPFDIPKKPLSNLLNEMTEYVATSLRLENDDQAIIQGLNYPFFLT